MKKTIFLLILVLCGISNKSFAQYQSVFGNDTTEWNGKYGYIDVEHSYSVKAYGDTVINNLHYKYVGSNINASQINPPIGTGQATGFIREDTITGRVWHIYNGEEILLMDMSLSVGDTFTFHIILSSDNVPEFDISLIVDTVYSFENRKYIGFDYDYLSSTGSSKLLFIESVGAVNMFSYLPTIFYYSWCNITCVHRDGALVYGDNNNCLSQGMGLIDIEKDNKIKLYPNPTKGIVCFDIQEDGLFNINIYNSLGIIVDKQITTSKTIDLSSYKAGLYFVQIQSREENYISIIIKQ